MRVLATMLLVALWMPCQAEDIAVAPGKGTISAAALRSKAGDVLTLAAGTYEDAVTLPADVTLRGAGADLTILVPTDRVAIQCAGPRITLQAFAIAGNDTFRAVNTDSAVRLAQVRITKAQEAVALMGAPLSDVIACEFIDCGVAVRAIAESSPTIYGCVFSGCDIGVLSVRGAPYVRNNLFMDCKEGVRIALGGSGNNPILRNNTFKSCTAAGVTILASKETGIAPFIRNSVFVYCAAAITCEPFGYSAPICDAAVQNAGDPPVRGAAGAASLDLAASRFVIADCGLTVTPEFEITLNAAVVQGKGIRMPQAPATARGDLGPEGISRFGTKLEVPEGHAPVRWLEPVFIANCVGEEYAAMRMLGRRGGSQSLRQGPSGPQDVFSGGGAETRFDISRFFGESSID